MSESPDEYDQSLRRLVRLTQNTLADVGDQGDVDEVAFARLREARAAARRPRSRRLGWALALAGAAFVALSGAATWRLAHRPSPLTFEIVEGPEPPESAS